MVKRGSKSIADVSIDFLPSESGMENRKNSKRTDNYIQDEGFISKDQHEEAVQDESDDELTAPARTKSTLSKKSKDKKRSNEQAEKSTKTKRKVADSDVHEKPIHNTEIIAPTTKKRKPDVVEKPQTITASSDDVLARIQASNAALTLAKISSPKKKTDNTPSGSMVEQTLTFQLAKHLSVEVAKMQDSVVALSNRVNTISHKEAFDKAREAYQDYIKSAENKLDEYEKWVATLQSQVDLLKGETDEYKKHGFVPNETLVAEINTLREQLEVSEEKTKALQERQDYLEDQLDKERNSVKKLTGVLADKEAEIQFLDNEMKNLEKNVKAAQSAEETLENKLREAKKELFVLEERMKKSTSHQPSNKQLDKMQDMNQLFQKVTGLIVEDVMEEKIDDIDMMTFKCLFKSSDSMLTFTLSIPSAGIDSDHRCIYTPLDVEFRDQPHLGMQDSLALLPEYLKDSVEFISLEKFFERMYYWGKSGVRVQPGQESTTQAVCT